MPIRTGNNGSFPFVRWSGQTQVGDNGAFPMGTGEPPPELIPARIGDKGWIEGISEVIGEVDAEIGGFRSTRLTADAAAGATTLAVESVLDWEDEGKIALDGVVYYYTGKTNTSLTGISHIAAGSSVNGAVIDHRDKSQVVDLSRAWNALDQVRRAMLVDYAEGEDLSIIGRNLGVNRLPLFSSDDQFRAVIKALAYNPKGTYFGLELALESLVGAGNYEIYEDLLQYPNVVFIKLTGSAAIGSGSAGKAFLTKPEWIKLAGTQNVLTMSQEPITIGSVRLKDLNELFDFRDDKPSAVTYAYWEGATPDNAFTYAGASSEGTYVTQVAGDYTKFETVGSTTFYRMTDAQGSRVVSETVAEVNALLSIPTGATLGSADLQQVSIGIFDGDYEVKCGVDADTASTFEIGLFNTEGGGFLGSTRILQRDQFYEIVLRKFADQYVELYAGGTLVTRVDYSSFSVSTTDHKIEFGIRGTPPSGMEVWYKQLGAKLITVKDYWNSHGVAGSVATANPTQFVGDGGSDFQSVDVGKRIRILNSGITNSFGGNNNGEWLIASLVTGPPTDTVILEGEQYDEDATVETANPTRITVDNVEAFTFPDDLGKKIIIYSSGLGNNGTYTISKLLEPGSLKDLDADFDTQVRTKTNICEVSSATFVSETSIGYYLEPVFDTESGLGWELSDTGSVAAAVLTLRQALWANDLVMEIGFTDVLSAQVMIISQILNEVIQTTPTLLYEYYPFYIADPLALFRAYITSITAAGVIPEYLLD